MNHYTPWVEKYRPDNFNNIVLDANNKLIFKNILQFNFFPNLLFYGPPGTGKTTTILNLVKSFHEKNNLNWTNENKKKILNKNLIMHLNASDERGIDVIRNQIYNFVNSKSLFKEGLKLVILDEVDYMTKNAQIALKYLLQDFKTNVRFCLICNYISRIDESLQNEFLRIRFNQLPEKDILEFLNKISKKEGLNYELNTLKLIQKNFNSDIRSMINYMQSNNKNIINKKIITNEIWDNLCLSIKEKTIDENVKIIIQISNDYNLDKTHIMKELLYYILKNNDNLITTDFLNFIENFIHSNTINERLLINHILLNLKKYLHF